MTRELFAPGDRVRFCGHRVVQPKELESLPYPNNYVPAVGTFTVERVDGTVFGQTIVLEGHNGEWLACVFDRVTSTN